MCSYLLSGTLYSAVPCIIYAMKNTFGWIGKAEDGYSCKTRSKAGMDFFFDLVRRGENLLPAVVRALFRQIFCGFGIVTSATPGAGGFGRNNHANMDATAKNLLNLQREEATLCEVYRRLAELEKDPVRRQTLVRIMHDERRHCAILKRRTGREMAPDPKRVFWYVWIMRVLGPAFVVRQMELCEKGTEASYSLYAEREEFIRIASEEKRHGEDLTNLAGGMRLSYMSSVVLGLNDALVEFTGALAGFTLALNEPRLVALTGSITGVAAALSMAASEYLSTKSDATGEKHPLRAALCTGTAYLVTVAILIIPYLLFFRMPSWH